MSKNSNGHLGVESNRSRPNKKLIADILASFHEELRQNPNAVMAALQKLADEFKSVLEYATNQDPIRQVAARERVRALQRTLQERGVEVGTTLEQLPDLLQFISQLGDEATAHKLAETLYSFAEQLNQSPEALGRKLDEFIASMERNFGTFVGSAKARQQEQIYQEAKVSARSAIAESLRAHGIAPLTSPEAEHLPDRENPMQSIGSIR